MISVRPATIDDCEAIGLVTVTASHSAFIGVIPEQDLDFSWTPEVSASGWRSTFAQNTDRDQIFLVAVEDSQVIGFVWAKPWAETKGFDAVVQALYVLPTQQRRGIGRLLLRHVVVKFTAGNLQKLEIGCVRQNPSCEFYRQLGGLEIARRPVQVDQFSTEEIIFGWPDMSVLIDPQSAQEGGASQSNFPGRQSNDS